MQGNIGNIFYLYLMFKMFNVWEKVISAIQRKQKLLKQTTHKATHVAQYSANTRVFVYEQNLFVTISTFSSMID